MENGNKFTLFDSLPIGVAVISPGFIVEFWNAVMEYLTGISKASIIGKDITNIFPNLNRKIYKESINNVFAGGSPVLFSSQLHGNVIPCRTFDLSLQIQHTMINSYKDPDTGSYYAVLSVQDVTNESRRAVGYRKLRDQLAAELQEKENLQGELIKSISELEKSKRTILKKNAELIKLNKQLKKTDMILQEFNTSRDKFYSLVTHDLKSPYQGMLGISEILSTEINILSKEEIRIYSSELHHTLKQHYKLLTDLLEWAKIQSGKIKYELTRINIFEIVNVVNMLLQNMIEKKSLLFQNLIPEDSHIIGDSHILHSVLQNLITNAIKFSNEGGKIIISFRRTRQHYKITVTDEGVGMGQNVLENLANFDTIISTYGTWNEKGTGLGLLMCKELLAKHNGQLDIKSQLKKGTAITISIKDTSMACPGIKV